MASGSSNYNNEPNMESVESKVDEVKVVSESIMAKVNTLADKVTLDNINSYISSLSKQSTSQSILDKVNAMPTSVVKSVQRGEFKSKYSSTRDTITIGTINSQKSILLVENSMSYTTNGGGTDVSSGVKGMNLVDNKFDVIKHSGTNDMYIAWQVIEFY